MHILDIVAPLSTQGDASTIPLGGPRVSERLAAPGWLSARRNAAESASLQDSTLAGAIALSAIVAVSLLLVLMVANRPSLLSATTHTGYFPRWMAGPLGGLLSGFTNDGTTLKDLFTAGIVLMYASYLVALKHASRLPVRWLVAAILAAHAIFFLSPPLALTDVFNYVNYARMEVVHNLNPYTTIPILEPHNDPSFLLSNWHQLLSPYGPLFTLVTFAVVPFGVAFSFWAIKAIIMIASLTSIFLVSRCARLLGRDPRAAVAFFGLNPLVLVWGLGGDHNDFLMLLCLMTGFYLLLRARAVGMVSAGAAVNGSAGAAANGSAGAANGGARTRITQVDSPASLRGWLLPLSPVEMGAGAAFVAAAGFKASGAILIPVVLAFLLRAPRALTQMVLGMLVAVVLLGAASLLAFGVHFPNLSSQDSLVTAESIPNLLGLALGLGGESAGLRIGFSVLLVLLVGLCCWRAWSRRWFALGPERALQPAGSGGDTLVTAAGWASVALLVTLSWILPWYVLWVLPFAALSSSRRLRAASVALAVYLILTWAPASGLLTGALHFYPEKTPLARLHHRFVGQLLH